MYDFSECVNERPRKKRFHLEAIFTSEKIREILNTEFFFGEMSYEMHLREFPTAKTL